MNPYGDTETERKIAELAATYANATGGGYDRAVDALRSIVYEPAKLPNLEALNALGVKPGPLTRLSHACDELVAVIWHIPPFCWIDDLLWWLNHRM